MNIIRGGNDVDQINFKCLKVRPQVFRTCLGWGLDCAKIFIESSVRQSKSVVWLMIKWIPWSMPCNMKSAEYYPKWENLHDWLLTAKLRKLEIEWSGWAAQLQVQAGQETTQLTLVPSLPTPPLQPAAVGWNFPAGHLVIIGWWRYKQGRAVTAADSAVSLARLAKLIIKYSINRTIFSSNLELPGEQKFCCKCWRSENC